MKPVWLVVLMALMMSASMPAPLSAEPPSADHADHMMPAPPPHPLFDRIKALEGRWEGTMSMGDAGESMPAVMEFRVTAGGSAVIETQFPGTPMEMISVYFVDDGTLKMTHYCIAQNQPTLIGSPGEKDNLLELRFDSATNMPDPNAVHMRNATLEFIDDDHYRCHGEGYANGEPMPESCGVLDMRRVRPADSGKTPG